MKPQDEIIIVFKNDQGEEATLETSIKNLLEKTEEDLYEQLEEEAHNYSCTNESQNFCECNPRYENYFITEIRTKP